MPLKQLIENGVAIEAQQTSSTLDVLGHYICNTWEEAVHNGGAPFDAIVLGAGMFGAYCAAKIHRHGAAANKRVLVLEAGGFLVSEHVQNLARIGLNIATPVSHDPGIPRERVWGLPWRGNQASPGLAYCVGGRSLYWGGWTPRLTAADHALWPTSVADFLKANYTRVEQEIGVTSNTDFVTGALYTSLFNRLNAVRAIVPHLDTVEAAPLAVQGATSASGLFSFDKFSSVPILIEAIRETTQLPNSARRLILVPHVHVLRLHTSGDVVSIIEVDVAGQRKYLSISPHCAVILAMGAIESTRVALASFPTPLMGRNLMAHLRTNMTVRIRRSGLMAMPPTQLETAAVLVRGSTPQSRFHLQFTASASSSIASEELLFRMIPDLDLLSTIVHMQTTEWITITVRGLGEMEGLKKLPVPNASGSWINLSPFEFDEFGIPRAWVQLTPTATDKALWDVMDQTAVRLVQTLVNNPNDIEYFYNGVWHNTPPTLDLVQSQLRDGLGATHHEAGTLWMGCPGTSVTNENGRFHHVSNAYAADLSLFPTVGSANPGLIGLTLAEKVAAAIA